MKKYLKLTLSLMLVLVMVLQLSAVAFAANIGQISYSVNGLNVSASVFAMGLSSGAKLVTAVYDTYHNIVDYDVSENVEDATTYLMTKVTKEDESNLVKSFIWTSDGKNSPYGSPGVLGHEATADDVELFFDGVPFAKATGEALNFEKTSYDVVLKDVDSNGTLDFPKVTYSVKDSTIDLDITHDYENLTSTIVIESGVRLETEVSVTNGNTASYYDYSKPYTENITINYVMPTNIINDDSYFSARTAGLGGITSLTNANSYYDYVLSFDAVDGAVATPVNFSVKGLVNSESIIVIEPKNDVAASSYRDTVVNSDGSALSWTDDDKVVYGYNYAGSTEEEILKEAFDASRATFDQYAATSSLTVTYNSGTDAKARLMRRVHDSDNYFVSGNYARYNDRYPAYGLIEFITPNSNLVNCNYITFQNKNISSYDVTFSFYVNQSVNVHVVTKSGSATVKKANEDAVTGTAGAAGFSRRYQNAIAVTTIPYAVSKGYANINDLSSYNAAQNKTYTVTIDGVAYTFKLDQVYLRKWATVKKLEADGYSNGVLLTPGALEILGYQPEDGATDTAKTYNIASMWNSGDLTGVQAVIDKYTMPSAELGTAKPIITNPVMCTGYEFEYEGVTYTMDFNLVDGTSTKVPTPKLFPDVASGNRSLLSDRDGINRNNLTGMIKSYPETMDLEDGVFLQAIMRAGEGTAIKDGKVINAQKICYQMEQVPFYTFIVNYDCEVIIATQDHDDYPLIQTLIDDGYSYYCMSSEEDAVTMQYLAPSAVRQFIRLYTKKFNAGDTVTVYTPASLAYISCFIKPIHNN